MSGRMQHENGGVRYVTVPAVLHWLGVAHNALNGFGQCVELGPGDALYVPLMWPHNVDAAGFSVTANRYLRRPDDRAWLDYVDRRKTNAWLLYERATGVALC